MFLTPALSIVNISEEALFVCRVEEPPVRLIVVSARFNSPVDLHRVRSLFAPVDTVTTPAHVMLQRILFREFHQRCHLLLIYQYFRTIYCYKISCTTCLNALFDPVAVKVAIVDADPVAAIISLPVAGVITPSASLVQ